MLASLLAHGRTNEDGPSITRHPKTIRLLEAVTAFLREAEKKFSPNAKRAIGAVCTSHVPKSSASERRSKALLRSLRRVVPLGD
jgi:hypothetical protein